MKEFKFLIIIPYFNRPNMFREGLKSLTQMTYDNWEVSIIDDGSDEDKKASDVVKEVFGEGTSDYAKVKLYETGDSLANKLRRGSIHSTYMNKAISESDADYAIMISDDDGLHADYLRTLNDFYNDNPSVSYSFSHIIPYDPMEELPGPETLETRKFEIRTTGRWRDFNSTSHVHVNHIKDVPPVDVVDATQVSWNIKDAARTGCVFDERIMINCDRDLFAKLFRHFGGCVWNKTVGPYKAFHANQMGVRHRSAASMYEVIDKNG